MSWVDLFFAYVTAVDAVVSTVSVWGPLLLGAASLGWGVRRAPRGRRRRRTRRPDMSAADADNSPDAAALMFRHCR